MPPFGGEDPLRQPGDSPSREPEDQFVPPQGPGDDHEDRAETNGGENDGPARQNGHDGLLIEFRRMKGSPVSPSGGLTSRLPHRRRARFYQVPGGTPLSSLALRGGLLRGVHREARNLGEHPTGSFG